MGAVMTPILVALVVAGAAYLALVEVLGWLVDLLVGPVVKAPWPTLPRARARWRRP
jgi:hypothetical protein